MCPSFCNASEESGFCRSASRLVLLCGLWFVCNATVWAEDFEFFEKKIRPVLADHCYPCHSLAAEKLKSGLLLDSKAGTIKGGDSGKPAIVPGKAEVSLLIEAIRYTNQDLQMPPPKFRKLSDQQIGDFVAWINMGAPDPRVTEDVKTSPLSEKYQAAKKHWAFQPVGNPTVPEIENATRK